MVQRVYEVTAMPGCAITASAAFMQQHLAAARALIGTGPDEELVIVLPPAGPDHRNWRLALARDLARAHAPARVNVVAGRGGAQRAAILHYLGNAQGVTGHYLEFHEPD